MIDHLSIGVSDLARAAAFYDAVLAPLGYARVLTHARAMGRALPRARASVDAFHAAALSFDATDEGAPGLRPQHGETSTATASRPSCTSAIEQ